MTLSKAKRRRRRSGAGDGDGTFRVCSIKASAANQTAQRMIETTSKARGAPSVGRDVEPKSDQRIALVSYCEKKANNYKIAIRAKYPVSRSVLELS